MGDTSTMSVTHLERDQGPAVLRRRRLLYALMSTILLALALAAVADTVAPVFGVDSAVVEDRTADGVLLRVEYPELTRPALASPFAIEVTDPDGFTENIEVAVSRPFIEVWDENGFYPTPSSETGDDDWVVWEFEPPDATTFRFFYDARLEPARQTGVTGTVQLRDGGAAIAQVSFDVAVRP